MSEALDEVIEDAIWHALDEEQGTPHSGVDMALVVAGFLERLTAAGYAIVKAEPLYSEHSAEGTP